MSAADRRWIDFLTQVINETWDESQPERPKTLGFMGSEEFIRLQFEEYLLALLSCMKYHEELHLFNTGETGHKSRAQLEAFNIEGDPALEFNAEFLAQWRTTSNYALFQRLTSDALLFSIVEPRHPCAGGLTIDDVQRRIAQQVAELHLDERVREGREALGRHLSTGQKKVSAVFNSFWADIDAMRDAQRRRNEERASQTSPPASLDIGSPPLPPSDTSANTTDPDHKNTLDNAPPVSQRAGAYLSSWGSWASEKRREWQEKKANAPSVPSSPVTSPSTPTLTSTSEVSGSNNSKPTPFSLADRGRTQSMPRYSEDQRSIGPSPSSPGRELSRSNSRRKRWSNILLRRDSGDYQRPALSLASPTGNTDMEYPRSPLSREAPIDEDFALSTRGDSSESTSSLETLSKPETTSNSVGENAATSKTETGSPTIDSTSKESEAGWENVDLTSKANTPLSEVPPNEPKSTSKAETETATGMGTGA